MASINNIKVLVASTIYGYQDQLASIYAQLDSYGYRVMNSHMGTVYAGADKSNLANCLAAVDECDAFLGIIRPDYGSGVIGETSITHEEVLRAILLKKARWFLVDSKVVFARQLLNKSEIVDRHTLKPIKTENIIIRPNSLIDVRCIEIYNAVTKDKVPPKERVGHWAQEFYDLPGMQRYIEGQFADPAKVQKTINYMKGLTL
jgi:hypothetical protein